MRRNGRRQYLRRNRNRNHSRTMRRDFNYRKFMKELGNWAIALLITIILAYSIITYGVQTLTVIGQSMKPVLTSGDVVIINKLAYNFSEPERYDIIAFKLREGDNSYYNIKRVIALPGETIAIKDGIVLINGKERKDMPFNDKIATEGLALDGVTLGEGEYFLLGDNVNNSEDSRFANIGNVMDGEILGKVTYRWSPSDKRGPVK